MTISISMSNIFLNCYKKKKNLKLKKIKCIIITFYAFHNVEHMS